jgi:hypothetical protein
MPSSFNISFCETSHRNGLMMHKEGRFSSQIHLILRGPLAKLVDPPYYSESELCGGAVTVSLSKYLPW